MTNETYKILIVDDEEMNLRILSDFLSCDQYSLYTAKNGKEAVDLAKNIIPDLVLLDVLMPELDGTETCRILKCIESTKQIPVIMLTAYADKDTKLRCLRVGANDFISKPFDNDELQLRVQNMLEFKRHAETKKWNEMLLQNKAILEGKNQELDAALLKIHETQILIFEQEKLASIGQLTAGVAHEINNPMGFISSNLTTLCKYIDKMVEFINAGDQTQLDFNCSAEADKLADVRKRLKIDHIIADAHQLILECQDGTGRVLRIVKNLSNFSRVDQVNQDLFNLNNALENTINIAWNEIKYVAAINREYGDVPEIICFPQQLNQVFLNLMVNAGQAMEGTQGSITIRTWCTNDNVFVAISDTGCGIPIELQHRIFEPFFTTKEVGKGTGLGLSISYDIIRKHGGEITVESTSGKGTTFTVRLPIDPKNVILGHDMAVEAKNTNNTIRILLVEDDLPNQVAFSRLLSKTDYQVEIAENGREALKLLEGKDFDVVLMDCRMPVMDGYEATAVIRDQSSKVRNHAIPIIALTANAMREDRKKCLDAGMDDYLPKPIEFEDLLTLLDKWVK